MSTASFEDLVTLIETNKHPFDLARQMPKIVEGLANLRDRVRAIEESRVADMHRMQELEALTKDEKTELTSIAKDRTALQQQAADLEHRLATLETKKDAAVIPATVKPVGPPDVSSTVTSPSFSETLGFGAKTPTPTVTQPTTPVHVPA